MTDTARRVVAGAGWLYGHRWIERLLDFAAVAVLARMLSPGDFGLVAIAASVVAIVEGLGAFGIDSSVTELDEGGGGWRLRIVSRCPMRTLLMSRVSVAHTLDIRA